MNTSYRYETLFSQLAVSICPPDQVEERIFLIDAVDENDASSLALSIGGSEEHQYETSAGRLRWEFVQIERICDIEGELTAGTELSSRFLRASEVKSLLTRFE